MLHTMAELRRNLAIDQFIFLDLPSSKENDVPSKVAQPLFVVYQ